MHNYKMKLNRSSQHFLCAKAHVLYDALLRWRDEKEIGWIPVTKMQRESTAKRSLAAGTILLGLFLEEGEGLLHKVHK